MGLLPLGLLPYHRTRKSLAPSLRLIRSLYKSIFAESKYTDEMGDANSDHRSSVDGFVMSFWSRPDRPYTSKGKSVTLLRSTSERLSSVTQNLVVTV